MGNIISSLVARRDCPRPSGPSCSYSLTPQSPRATTSPANDSVPFLKLPPEIRLRIYEFATEPEELTMCTCLNERPTRQGILSWQCNPSKIQIADPLWSAVNTTDHFGHKPKDLRRHPLGLICRQIKEDTENLLTTKAYSRKHVYFCSIYCMKDFLRMCLSDEVDNILSITVLDVMKTDFTPVSQTGLSPMAQACQKFQAALEEANIYDLLPYCESYRRIETGSCGRAHSYICVRAIMGDKFHEVKSYLRRLHIEQVAAEIAAERRRRNRVTEWWKSVLKS